MGMSLTLYASAHGEEWIHDPIVRRSDPAAWKEWIQQHVLMLSVAGDVGSVGLGLGDTPSYHNPRLSIPEREMTEMYEIFRTTRQARTALNEVSTLWKQRIREQMQYDHVPFSAATFGWDRMRLRSDVRTAEALPRYALRSLGAPMQPVSIEEEDQLSIPFEANMIRLSHAVSHDRHCSLQRPVYNRKYTFGPHDDETNAHRAHYGLHLVHAEGIDVGSIHDEGRAVLDKNNITTYRWSDTSTTFGRKFYRHFQPKGRDPIASLTLRDVLQYCWIDGCDVNVIDSACRSVGEMDLLGTL